MSKEKTPTPTRGIPVELDRKRRLRYPMRIIREIRKEFGDDALTMLSDEHLGKMLWYGLKHEDDSLTVQQVEDMVDMENLKDVVQAMTKALGFKEGEANPPTPPAAPAVESGSASA